MPEISKPVKTYGVNEEADVRAIDVKRWLAYAFYRIALGKLSRRSSITLNLPGWHNMLNALAAITVATCLGVDDGQLLKVLRNLRVLDDVSKSMAI